MKFLIQRISSVIFDLIYKIKSKHRYKKRLKDIKKRDPYIYK